MHSIIANSTMKKGISTFSGTANLGRFYLSILPSFPSFDRSQDWAQSNTSSDRRCFKAFMNTYKVHT